jgi:anthranilate phosphoribosyltransferase
VKTTFDKLIGGYSLEEGEAYQLLNAICNQELNPSQVAAVMAFYMKKPVSVNELSGFRASLLELCRPVSLDKECLDVCGTGGDQKNTFNISTLSAFVLAACGIPVAKHGNYGSSSVSGSSDILAHLGYKFKTSQEDLNEQLNQHNLCFIHAPLFHPALKSVASSRRELGVRTFFNLLGPLVNPARPQYKYIGVYDLSIARLYKYILQKEGQEFVIVTSLDGYDEVSLTASFKHISGFSERTIDPFDLGMNLLCQSDLYGGATIEAAAEIFLDVLQDKCTPAQKNAVLINSALAMQCVNKESINDNLAACREAIESGRAYSGFKNIISN